MSFSTKIRDAGSSLADLRELRRKSQMSVQAAANAAMEAAAAGADEDEVQ